MFEVVLEWFENDVVVSTEEYGPYASKSQANARAKLVVAELDEADMPWKIKVQKA